jgi:hypothetical protein
MHVYGGDPSCLNIIQFQWSRWSLIKENILFCIEIKAVIY